MVVQAAQKGLAGGTKRKRRRGRGGAAKTNVSSSELSDLYDEKQVNKIALLLCNHRHKSLVSQKAARVELYA